MCDINWQEFPRYDLLKDENDIDKRSDIIEDYYRSNSIDINTKYGGYTCFLYALAANMTKLIKTIISHYSDQIDYDSTTPSNETALHLAVQQNYSFAVHFLLKSEADPNIRRSVDSQTPLHLAVLNKSTYLVKCLLNVPKIDVNVADSSGSTALHYAVQKDDSCIATLLLKSHADPNVVRKDGKTALHFVAENGSNAILHSLVDRGAELNIADVSHLTPLHLAVKAGNASAVASLLQRGANPNFNHSSTASNAPDPLHIAVLEGNNDLVGLLLDSELLDLNSCNSKGETALHLAVKNCDKYITDLLIEMRADPNVIVDGFTPLHIAVAEEDIEMIGLLVKCKSINLNQAPIPPSLYLAADRRRVVAVNLILEANLNVPDERKIDQNVLESSLHMVVEKNFLECVKALLKYGVNPNQKDSVGNPILRKAANSTVMKLLIEYGADVNATDKWSWSPLHVAVGKQDLESVIVLLDHEANPNITHETSGISPLHLAVITKQYDTIWMPRVKDRSIAYSILKVLLGDKRINVNIKDRNSLTPIDIAFGENNPGAVELLLKHNANPEIGSNRRGKGLLHFAAMHKNSYMLGEFLKGNAVAEINTFYKELVTPLFIAVAVKDLESVKRLLHHQPDVNLLNITDTVLTSAFRNIKNESKELIEVLLKVPGINVNLPGMGGLTPLHLAIEQDKKMLALELIKLGADVNVKDDRGSTPLHLAAINEYPVLIKFLVIEQNAQVDAQDGEGLTALHLVCAKTSTVMERKYLVNLLLEYKANIHVRCFKGNTIFHYLAINDSLDILKKMKVSEVPLLDEPNKNGETPLHLACQKLCHQTIKLLLEAGVSTIVTDSVGEAPFDCYLHSLINSDDLNLSEKVVGGSSKNILKKVVEKIFEKKQIVVAHNLLKFIEIKRCLSVKYLSSLLNFAVKNEFLGLVKALLKCGADVNFKRDHHFGTEEHINLYLALENIDILKVLLAQENCDVNLPGRDSKTALHYALEKKCTLTVVRLLLEKGANPNASDSRGLTPYQYTTSVQMTELLLMYGADPFYTRYSEGACVFNNDHQNYLISRAVVKRMLLEDTTEVEMLSQYAGSPHMKACRAGIAKCSRKIDRHLKGPDKLDTVITYRDIIAENYSKINEGNIEKIVKIINSRFPEQDIPLYFKVVRTMLNIMKLSFPIVKPIGTTKVTLKSFLGANPAEMANYLENPEVKQFLRSTNNMVTLTPRYSYEIYHAIMLGNKAISLRNKIIKNIRRQGSHCNLAKMPTEILERIWKKLGWHDLLTLDEATPH